MLIDNFSTKSSKGKSSKRAWEIYYERMLFDSIESYNFYKTFMIKLMCNKLRNIVSNSTVSQESIFHLLREPAFQLTTINARFFWLQSPGTLHKDVGGAGTKVSEKTVGGVGTATLTTLSSINNASNAGRNKNNPVSHEVSYNAIGRDESERSSRIDRSRTIRHPGPRRWLG